MNPTDTSRLPVEQPWMVELSAAGMLLYGWASIVSESYIDEPGLVGTVSLLVIGALTLGSICFATGLAGRIVSLPVRRKRALDVAAALGMSVVVTNGILAARSLRSTAGAEKLLVFIALTAAAVGGVLGGLLALARVFGS